MKRTAVLALCLTACSASLAPAQTPPDAKPSIEIYGFGQVDAIADFNQNNPDWYDVVRPSRLPNVAKQFGEDGHFYMSERSSVLNPEQPPAVTRIRSMACWRPSLLASARTLSAALSVTATGESVMQRG